MDGEQDEQVAGQRARPVRGHRPLRDRRAALLPAARRHLRRRTARSSTEAFERRYEGELANELGNLASRTIAMIGRYRDGAVPDVDVDPALAGEFDGLADRVADAHGPRRADAGARRRSGSACGGSTATSRSRRRGSSPRTPSAPADLDRVLRTLAEGLRVVTVLLAPWLPERGREAARRARRPRPRARRRRASARGRSARSARSSRCSPSTSDDSRVIDSHTHLDSLRAAERRARRGGGAARASARILTVGMDRRPNRTRARGGRGLPAGLRRRRPPPQPRRGLRRRRPGRPRRRWPRHAALRGDRRDRPGLLPRLRAARRPGARVPRADRARARDRQAAGDPHPRRRGRHDRHAAARARTGSQVILHCFSMPDRLDECLAEGWWISFAGNVTYPKAQRPRRGGRARPRRPPARRDRRAVPHAAGVRKERNQPAFVAHTARFVAERRGVSYEELERARRAQRRRAVRVVSARRARPPQPSLRRLRQFGVRPKRDLGQNFLIDSNILGVIERAAELGADDVVLEIGGGLGVLSEHLAPRVRARPRRRARPRARAGARRRARRRTRTRRCTSPTR